MSTNDRHSTDAPLSEAELDLLASLDAARTPGTLVLAVSSRGEFCIFGGADGEVPIATLPRGRGPDAQAFVAMVNALPALLAEVRRWRGRERARDGWAEPDGDDEAGDDGPRLHIPRDLLTREGAR